MGGLLSLVWSFSTSRRRALQQPSDCYLSSARGVDNLPPTPDDILNAAIARFHPHLRRDEQCLSSGMDEQKLRKILMLDDDDDDSDATYDPGAETSESEDSDALTNPSGDDDDDLESYRSEQSRRAADRSYYRIPDKEEYLCLEARVRGRCGYSRTAPSVAAFKRRMELGSWRPRRGAAPPATERVTINNRFLPNKRQCIDQLTTKSFCCHYQEDTQTAAIASQDAVVRFYSRSTGGEYLVDRKMRVPVSGWSILDVVLNPASSLMAYSTWSDSIYYRNINEGRVDANGCLTASGSEGWRSERRRRKERPHPPLASAAFITNRLEQMNSDDDERGGPEDFEEDIPWQSVLLEHSYSASHRMAVFSLRFSHDGDEIVCGAADNGVHVVNVERQQRVLVLRAHEDDVNSVCYGDSNKNLIFSAGDDGLCKVWDRRALSESEQPPVALFAGHRDGITCINTRGDDRYLLTNSKDQSIKIWDLRKTSGYEAAERTRCAVADQNWDYRWQLHPAGKQPPQPLDGDTSIATLGGHSVLHTLIRAKWSPLESTGGRFIYTGCATGEVVVYDTLTQSVNSRLRGHRSVVRDCVWCPDTNELITTSWDGQTAAWHWEDPSKFEEENEAAAERKARRRQRMEDARNRRAKQGARQGSKRKRRDT